jgi:SurA-like N-terminal domain
MKRVALLAALLVVAAGCGGNGATVPPGSIALVDGRAVPRSALDLQLAQSRRAYAVRGQDFPRPGTAAYRRLQDTAVRLVVDRTRLELVAQKLGIVVRPAQIDARLRRFKRTAFGGSEARYRARLRAIGMTEADVRRATRDELLVAAVEKAEPSALTKSLSVSYAKGFAPADDG